jgi:hypothetical protein
MDRPRSTGRRVASGRLTGGRVTSGRVRGGRLTSGRVRGGRLTGGRVTAGRVVAGWVAGGRVPGRRRLAPLCAAAALASITLAACGSSQVPGASGASASPTAAATVARSSTALSPGVASPGAASPGAASPGPAATQVALCRRTSSVTGLEIVRNQVVRVPVLQIGFPDQVTMASPAGARAVARALCALPPMPRGIFNCPNLVPGTTYQLRFTAGGRRLAAVTIEATGCEVVTGVGPARWVATSPGFWRVLGTAAHVRPPGRSAFSGGSYRGPICDPIRGEQANACPALVQPGGVAVP